MDTMTAAIIPVSNPASRHLPKVMGESDVFIVFLAGDAIPVPVQDPEGHSGAGRGRSESSGEWVTLVEIAVIGRIDEQTAAALYLIDDGFMQPFGDRGTAFAAPQVAILVDMPLAHIIGRVHDDGPFFDIVVPAFLYSSQSQRIAVIADKRLPGKIETQTAHMAVVAVGEAGGHQHARIPPMRDQRMEKQAAIDHIDHKKTPLRRREREIDDRQYARIGEVTVMLECHVALQGALP